MHGCLTTRPDSLRSWQSPPAVDFHVWFNSIRVLGWAFAEWRPRVHSGSNRATHRSMLPGLCRRLRLHNAKPSGRERGCGTVANRVKKLPSGRQNFAGASPSEDSSRSSRCNQSASFAPFRRARQSQCIFCAAPASLSPSIGNNWQLSVSYRASHAEESSGSDLDTSGSAVACHGIQPSLLQRTKTLRATRSSIQATPFLNLSKPLPTMVRGGAA